MHIRIGLVLALMLVISGGSFGAVKTISYVEYVDIWHNNHGGRIYWQITGAQSVTLKNELRRNYDTDRDGKIEMVEAVSYVEELSKYLVNQQVGTVIVKSAQPLHGWSDNGNSINACDISGLLGNLSLLSNITIKMRFSGVATSSGNLNSIALSKLPFAAASKTNISAIVLPPNVIKREHTELGLTFANYADFSNALVLRLVFGTYYYSSSTGDSEQSERFEKVPFSIVDSPFVLFISLLLAVKFARYVEHRNYNAHIGRGSTYRRRRKVKRYNLILQIMLIFCYIFSGMFVFTISGIMYLLILVVYALAMSIISQKIYSAPLPTVRGGVGAVEALFLLNSKGEKISYVHMNARSMDNEIVKSIITAINEHIYVKKGAERKAEESTSEYEYIEFYTKKIYFISNNRFIIAALMSEDMDSYVFYKLKDILNTLESKCGELSNAELSSLQIDEVNAILDEFWT